METEGVDPADAETIRRTVAGAEFASGESHLLAWSNPDTGSSGTITAIENTISGDGRPCRKFSTTLDSFMGISLYDGETCELREGLWILSRLARNRAE